MTKSAHATRPSSTDPPYIALTPEVVVRDLDMGDGGKLKFIILGTDGCEYRSVSISPILTDQYTTD